MSTPYLPPGATPRLGNNPADAGVGPGEPSTSPHATPEASGYRPPSAAGSPSSDVHAATTAGAPERGYVPPATGPTPSAAGPKTPEPETSEPEQPAAPASDPERAGRPPVVPPPAGPHRTRRRLLMLAGIAVLLVALVLGGAALMGLFAPKMSRLPGKVGAYAKEAPAQKATPAEYDAATYRAGAGDLYTAVLTKRGTDPAAGFSQASKATRFQLGDVYCTGVSKGGKGGNCSVALETGAVLTVSGSTRHAVDDLAKFTADVRDGVR